MYILWILSQYYNNVNNPSKNNHNNNAINAWIQPDHNFDKGLLKYNVNNNIPIDLESNIIIKRLKQ